MVINIGNFFYSRNKDSIMGDFQDLDHLDGVSISTTTANLYGNHNMVIAHFLI